LIAEEITTPLFRTAASGMRWVISGIPGFENIIQGFTGNVHENLEARITVDNNGNLAFTAPSIEGSTGNAPGITLYGGVGAPDVLVASDEVHVVAGTANDILLTLTDAGFKFGAGGTPFKELAFTSYSGTTDASAVLNVAHGMSDAPTWAGAFPGNTGATLQKPTMFALDSTNVRIRAVNTTTGALSPSTAISGYLLALR